jgi:hypothetical protein
MSIQGHSAEKKSRQRGSAVRREISRVPKNEQQIFIEKITARESATDSGGLEMTGSHKVKSSIAIYSKDLLTLLNVEREAYRVVYDLNMFISW